MRLLFFSLICACTGLAQNQQIQVRVVAFDNNNQPVTDLTSADFQIQEQGKPVPIDLFRGASSKPAATLILFNLLDPIDEKSARAQLSNVMTTIRPDDQVYVYLLTIHGLSAVRGLPQATQEKTGPPPIHRSFDYYMTSEFLPLMTRFGRLPGRKNMLWISSAFMYPQYLIATLQRDNIAMYPIDDFRFEVEDTYARISATELAERTGGRLHMQLDIPGTLQQAVDDARTSYMLGFTSPHADSKFHKLHIICLRPGVGILAPTGYYASIPNPHPPTAHLQSPGPIN